MPLPCLLAPTMPLPCLLAPSLYSGRLIYLICHLHSHVPGTLSGVYRLGHAFMDRLPEHGLEATEMEVAAEDTAAGAEVEAEPARFGMFAICWRGREPGGKASRGRPI